MSICAVLTIALCALSSVFARPERTLRDEDFTPSVGITDCIPSPNPYLIPDETQCDKYYICRQSERIPQLCPDGMAFEFLSRGCVLLMHADCSGRPLLQSVIKSSPYCPHRNGLFPHEDPERCDMYYHCVEGVPDLVRCPDTLLFDPVSGVCTYANNVDTSRCKMQAMPVKCPGPVDADVSVPTGLRNRLPHPTNCRRWYLCEGSVARLMGCEKGLAFNPKTRICEKEETVLACKKN